MAIALVQGPVNVVENDASVTASFTNTPTSGNLLVAYGRSVGAVLSGKASISGFTLASSTQITATAWEGIWYKVAGAGESKDVTLAWTDSTTTRLDIEEWGGFTGTPTLDKVADVDTTGGTVTSRSSGTTATTTANDELCVACWGQGAAVTSPSATNAFTLKSWDTFHIAYLVVSATGAYESTLSWTTARLAGGCIATFKGVSADTQLTVGGGTHDHTVGAVVLTQAHTLAPAASDHVHPAGGVALTQAHTLATPAASDHAQTVEAPVLTQAHVLAPAGADHLHGAASVIITQGHILTVQDAVLAHECGVVSMSQAHVLALLNGLHGHTVDPVILAQAHQLATNNSEHACTSDNVVVITAPLDIVLAVADVLHAHEVNSLTLSQIHLLIALSADHGITSDQVETTYHVRGIPMDEWASRIGRHPKMRSKRLKPGCKARTIEQWMR